MTTKPTCETCKAWTKEGVTSDEYGLCLLNPHPEQKYPSSRCMQHLPHVDDHSLEVKLKLAEERITELEARLGWHIAELKRLAHESETLKAKLATAVDAMKRANDVLT